MPEQNQQLEDRYQLQTYSKIPIAVERGSGCFVYDSTGQEYLDLYGGHCVASTGHCHPHVVRAITEQASKMLFYSNAVYCNIRGQAAYHLIKLAGKPFSQVFFVNSGAEANENAIKLARRYTGRRVVISTQNAFHGRTYGALSATGISNNRNYLNTPVPDHKILPYSEVADALDGETAAVLIEPIQSMGGVVEIPLQVLSEIQEACSRNGTLLIFDEIQTGVGRTGRFLYSQSLGLAPDLTTLAKGVASGYPAGGLLVSDRIARSVKHGDLGSTFGGSALACAAIEATLQVYESEALEKNAAEIGNYLKEQLLNLDSVEEVRGQGLLLGIRFENRTAKSIQQALLANKILAGTSSDAGILRLMPPLTITREEAGIFIKAVKNL